VQVVASVDKMSSSLSKLKKSSTAPATSAPIEASDDEKIRQQLILDVERFQDWIEHELCTGDVPAPNIECLQILVNKLRPAKV
jgi:hypothetical protein